MGGSEHLVLKSEAGEDGRLTMLVCRRVSEMGPTMRRVRGRTSSSVLILMIFTRSSNAVIAPLKPVDTPKEIYSHDIDHD